MKIIERRRVSNEQLDHAAEELVRGDADDPPHSEETVVEMVRITFR
jgi:hypothetical protein